MSNGATVSNDAPTGAAADAAGTATPQERLHAPIRYGPIERFFLFMAKTDMHVLQYCTSETRLTQSAIGFLVFVTGILAFVAAFFAVDSSFFDSARTPKALAISGLVALLYAVAIAAFDREVVSATGRLAAALRIPFAVLIGIVIAFPIEMKLLEGRIEAEIQTATIERNRDRIAEREQLLAQMAAVRDEALAPKRADVKSRQQQVDAALDEYNRERLRVACRERCAQRLADLEQARKELSASEQALSAATTAFDNDRSKRFAGQLVRIAQIDDALARERSSRDFLSQAMALDRITTTNPMAARLSTFIFAFFILFETFPVLVKLFLPYSEYHAYLDARRHLNVGKIITVANHATRQMRERPELVQLSDSEVTDIFERVMEDPLLETEPQGRAPRAVPAANRGT